MTPPQTSEPTKDQTSETTHTPIDPKLREARQEYSRLKLKLRETTDKDLKVAIKARIDQLRDEWGEPIELKTTVGTRQPSIVLPEKRTPPTDQEKRDAESILARARLEISRNKTRAGEDLMMEAVQKAPGDPGIMEALGDYYMTRSK